MLNGKKSVYIDSNIFLQEINEENFNSGSFLPQIPDPIRYFSKNFWTVANNQSVVAKSINDSNVLFKINYLDDDSIELIANKKHFIEKIINERGILEEKFNDKKWDTFILNLIPAEQTLFEDNYVVLQKPITISSLNNQDPNINFINREFVYNFDSKKYELLTSDKTIDILTFPQVLSVINYKQNGIIDREENAALSLGGLINQNYVESLIISKDPLTISKYFEEYSNKYSLPDARAVLTQIDYKNFNLSSLYNKNKVLKNMDFIPFPYYCDINFYNSGNNKDNVIHYINSMGKISTDLLKHLQEETENIIDKRFINIEERVEQKIISQYDLKSWINSEIIGGISFEGDERTKFYEENSRIYSHIEYTNLIEYIKNNIKPKARKYKNYMVDSSDNHLLIYKIQKRQFNSTSNAIQTFWMFPDDSDRIRLIDAQIKYGTEYFYTISAYVLTVGNEYHYQDSYYKDQKLKINDIFEGKYKLKVLNKPTYKILEIDMGSFSGAVHELPHTKPKIGFSKDLENLRINILQPQLTSQEEFEIIENKDFNLFESIKRAQQNVDADEIRSQAIHAEELGLQIYKTLTKPISYLSFQGKMYKSLAIGDQKSFVDTITPNIKYWYLFRYLNKHNTPSNVSDIYEVEMKNEDGYTYLVVNTLDLKAGPQKTHYKNMKRYMLIRPSVIQTQLKTPEFINNVDNIELGPKSSSVWNKDFIIRITSKKTNRILEFNLKSIINKKKQ